MKEVSETRTIVENSNSVKILKGLVISCIITFILLFIFAAILTYTNLSEKTIEPVVIAITGVSILIRKFNDNKLYKKKWYFKWWINWTNICITYIFGIKYNWKWIYAKYVFNIYDGNRNCSWNDRWSCRSEFTLENKKRTNLYISSFCNLFCNSNLSLCIFCSFS